MTSLPARALPCGAPRRRLLLVAALSCGLAGCAGYSGPPLAPSQGPIIPNVALNISPSLTIALEKIVTFGAWTAVAYLIIDPLAPNWEIEQAAFPGGHYHFSLKMKRFYSGGAGESRLVFHQRAKDLMRQGGYDGYQVVEYSEGMESMVLGSQRVSQGVIRLTRNEVSMNAGDGSNHVQRSRPR